MAGDTVAVDVAESVRGGVGGQVASPFGDRTRSGQEQSPRDCPWLLRALSLQSSHADSSERSLGHPERVESAWVRRAWLEV